MANELGYKTSYASGRFDRWGAALCSFYYGLFMTFLSRAVLSLNVSEVYGIDDTWGCRINDVEEEARQGCHYFQLLSPNLDPQLNQRRRKEGEKHHGNETCYSNVQVDLRFASIWMRIPASCGFTFGGRAGRSGSTSTWQSGACVEGYR